MTEAQKTFLKNLIKRDFEHLEIESTFTKKIMHMASKAIAHVNKGQLQGVIFWYRVLQSYYECWLNARHDERAHPVCIYRRNVLASITNTLDTLNRIAKNLAATA